MVLPVSNFRVVVGRSLQRESMLNCIVSAKSVFSAYITSLEICFSVSVFPLCSVESVVSQDVYKRQRERGSLPATGFYQG